METDGEPHPERDSPDRETGPQDPVAVSGPDVKGPLDRAEISKVLEVVEKDASAMAESFISLCSSLRSSLSQVSSTSVEHMSCFNEIVGRFQESSLDAATKGNRYINSCLSLNEEMKGMESLAVQLKTLRRNVDMLDSAVSKLLRRTAV